MLKEIIGCRVLKIIEWHLANGKKNHSLKLAETFVTVNNLLLDFDEKCHEENCTMLCKLKHRQYVHLGNVIISEHQADLGAHVRSAKASTFQL